MRDRLVLAKVVEAAARVRVEEAGSSISAACRSMPTATRG